MKIFHLLILIIFSNLLTSESEIEFSLNSDSIWRGITQNNGKPTVGANIYFSLDNGFFSGAWIENCCSGNSSYPNREIGYEFGYEKTLNEEIYLSVNYVGTNYPNSKIDNYDEIKTNISFFNFEISYFIGLDSFPDYYEISYNYDFQDISLYLSYGDFDSYKNDNFSNGSNYAFGIDTLQKGFSISLDYYFYNAKASSDLDDDGIVFSISKKTSF